MLRLNRDEGEMAGEKVKTRTLDTEGCGTRRADFVPDVGVVGMEFGKLAA